MIDPESDAAGDAHLGPTTPSIDGTFNVRDAGGLTTTTGSRVQTGHLFRSAALDTLTSRGISDVQLLNIRTVIDLRSPVEVERHGHFPTDRVAVRWEHLPSSVGPPSGQNSNQLTRMRDHPDPMAPMYREMLSQSGAEIARGFRILADSANLPAIVHCTSGKDRTGLFVALLHLVLGVSLDDVLAHYHQDHSTTQRAMSDMLHRYPEMAQMPSEKMERMAGTNSRWLTGALDLIGGEEVVPEWLDTHGCDAHTQAQLRSVFLH